MNTFVRIGKSAMSSYSRSLFCVLNVSANWLLIAQDQLGQKICSVFIKLTISNHGFPFLRNLCEQHSDNTQLVQSLIKQDPFYVFIKN